MSRYYQVIRFMLFVGTFFLISCNKEELKDSSSGTTLQNDSRFDNNGNSIRLTHSESEYAVIDYTYNQDGLVDRIDADYYGGYFKHEYNSNGRLIVARFFSHEDELQFRIEFFYDKNDVNHEIWYNGNTSEKVDEVFYTFNNKGQAIRMESPLLDYYATYEYSPQGNMTSLTFYMGGLLNTYVEYTYLHHHKNPTSAVPGRTYDYYSVGGHYDRNRWYSSSQYFVFYDEEGNPQVLSDQDPLKTIVGAGKSNYVTSTDYYEVLTDEWIHFTFTYDKSNNSGGVKKSSGKMSIPKLFERRSVKSFKEKVEQYKTQFKK